MQIDIKSFLNGSIGVGGGWCVCLLFQFVPSYKSCLYRKAFREDYPAKESRTKDLQPFFSCIITKV